MPCYVYPGLFANGKCGQCELYGKCGIEKDDPLISVSCRNCGFETKLKESFVRNSGILCPICREAILSEGKATRAGEKKG